VLAIAQHTVRLGKSIHVRTWTHPQAGEFIPVKKWNNLQGGQVHYTDAAVGASSDHRRFSAL